MLVLAFLALTFITVTVVMFLIFSDTKVGKIIVMFAYLSMMHTTFISGSNLVNVDKIKDTDITPVFKTVAHVNLDYRNDLELISVDLKNDIAYYRYTIPDYDIKQGDIVTLVGGSAASIVSIDTVGFTIECDNVVAGMSGTAVMSSSGKQIGLISERLPDNTVRCVWC